MSGERFLILFNSQGSNVIDNSNLNQVLYNVNWGAFLPKKYKRFHCQFVFKSINYNGAILNANGLVSINLGKVNVFDGNSETKNLGFVYPVLSSSGGGIVATGTAYQTLTTLNISTVTSGSVSLGTTIQLTGGNTEVIQALGTGTGLTGSYTVSVSQNVGNAGAPVNFFATGSNSSFYSSTNNDNNDFYINYPSNQQVLLSLRQFDGITALLAGAGANNTVSKTLHYVLYLSLEGIEE